MRKLLLSATALTAMVGIASAADLPGRAPAPAPAPYVSAPVFTWTGFYVGVNAGGAWNNKCSSWSPYAGGVAVAGWASVCGNNNNNNIAFTGGGQAGYNWQTGAFVFGIEADINGIANGNGNNNNYVAFAGAAPFAGTYLLSTNRPDWFGTVRGRLGYAFGPSLLYVTGGFAYGGNQNSSLSYWPAAAGVPPVGGATAVFTSGNNGNNIGWSLGGGWEYAFSNNWSAKIEYLHVQLGNSNSNAVVCTGASCPAFAAAATTFNRGNNRNSIDTVRVGLNYRFGGFSSSAPVLARY